MRRFEVGDRVRVDIPDRGDPDFGRYHGRTGEVIEVIEDEDRESLGILLPLEGKIVQVLHTRL